MLVKDALADLPALQSTRCLFMMKMINNHEEMISTPPRVSPASLWILKAPSGPVLPLVPSTSFLTKQWHADSQTEQATDPNNIQMRRQQAPQQLAGSDSLFWRVLPSTAENTHSLVRPTFRVSALNQHSILILYRIHFFSQWNPDMFSVVTKRLIAYHMIWSG